MQSAWIPVLNIHHILTDEAYIVAWVSLILGFGFYKLFLKKISDKRHNNLKNRFKSVPIFLIISTVLTLIQYFLIEYYPNDVILFKIASYISLISLLIGAVGIIKMAQIYIYLYLFFVNMSHGVPKLLANMFTFIFSLFIGNMIASSVFEIHLTALLTTSAVFSLVLGLALQDTLGNLFSGIAIQIESPFRIGDWIEITDSNGIKTQGQVQEISWRATFLLSFSEELIMFPNRMIAQGQITLITQGHRNIRLNQAFRFSYDTPIEKAKLAIQEGINQVPGIAVNETPIRILIIETNPQYLEIKVFYSLVDFSTRYRTGDLIITKILESIKFHGIKIQSPKIEIARE